MFHELNNYFASIHCNLDLALAHEGRPEAKQYLLQAQLRTRDAAGFIHGLQHRSEAIGEGPSSTIDSQAARPCCKTSEGRERILIADDDLNIRLLVKAVLEFRGYQVCEASNGQEAVEKFQGDGPFDMVILDLNMPKLGGSPALRNILAIHPEIPSLALTGMVSDPALKRPTTDIGSFRASISKPFDNEELLRTVRRLLDEPRSRNHSGTSSPGSDMVALRNGAAGSA
jgi:CheY-like chemotaxis protein